MVRTRKGTMIGEGFEERQGEDPLEDTASYMPLESQQSRLGESTGLIRDTDLRQIEGLQLEGSDQQRQLWLQLRLQHLQQFLHYMSILCS
jgi:hypothetical protein